ncbi:hypothetical protein V6N11_075269 [Hibiscus sabdariffa]|uniref:Uncharacterized protein n=1 Tax=Hibiscus sabdariffa TaxID=183260 RepID=A0ABR2R619_9ROSI
MKGEKRVVIWLRVSKELSSVQSEAVERAKTWLLTRWFKSSSITEHTVRSADRGTMVMCLRSNDAGAAFGSICHVLD